MRRVAPGVLRRVAAWAAPFLLVPAPAVLGLAASGRTLAAQQVRHQLSVPFTNGFIGVRGSSAGTADNVLTYATLGIARTFFIQSSSVPQFEQQQGNDIPGTLRIVRTDGAIIDMPASATWRQNSGQTTYLVGFLPRPASPITLAYPGGSVQITNGANPGGSSVGGYVARYAGPFETDGANTNGNAATSGVLGGLNDYLAVVQSQRPAGPVTVAAQSTQSSTPTVAGTATLGAGEQLSVAVGGVQYTAGTSPAVVRSGAAWSLALAAPLAVGTYDVSATVTDTDGFTLSDATTNELTVTGALRQVTLAGAFAAATKSYDGTTAATLSSHTLTLVGVQTGDQVSVGAVTLAFGTPSAGAAKPVAITGVTLAGANAAHYAVDLTGAPAGAAEVRPAALSITGVTAADRAYDGTTAATLAGTPAYAGLRSGESFPVAGVPTAHFADAAAGPNKAVTVAGFAPPNANYTVAQPGPLAARITPHTLTLAGTFTAADKVADGAAAAAVTAHALQLVGVVAPDAVALGAVTATFADAAAGANKPVTLTGAALTGAAAPNYALSLAGAPATTASITAAAAPPSDPPSAPVGVAAAPADRALALTWAPPASSGCSAVTGYVAEVRADGGTTWTRTTLGAPGAVTGLTNNVAYEVRVAAANACGTGPFAAAPARVIPIAPTRDGAGQLPPAPPGTVAVTVGGAPQPVAVEVVQDTVLRLSGNGFALRLRAVDQPGASIPVDSSRTVLLEGGGRAVTDGSGFAPGSVTTAYLFAPGGAPQLLGTAPVTPDGAFAATLPVPDTLRAGPYTLQVNGVDRAGTPRAVSLGVEVAPPPPDLALTATPDDPAPAVGDTITVTLAVTNVGRGPAVHVVIPRAFDEPGFTIVRASPVDGTYDTPTHTWTIPRIEVGAHARLRFTAIVLPPAAPPAESAPVAQPSRP